MPGMQYVDDFRNGLATLGQFAYDNSSDILIITGGVLCGSILGGPGLFGYAMIVLAIRIGQSR